MLMNYDYKMYAEVNIEAIFELKGKESIQHNLCYFWYTENKSKCMSSQQLVSEAEYLCHLDFSHSKVLHIIVNCKQCLHRRWEEAVGSQRLKPADFAKILNNKLNVAAEMLYDSDCLSGRKTLSTVFKSTWLLLLLNGFCTLNRFICGWCNHKFEVVWFGIGLLSFHASLKQQVWSCCRPTRWLTPHKGDLFRKAKVKHKVSKAKFLHEFIAELAKRHTWK